MRDQQALAVRRFVDGFLRERDAAKAETGIIAQHLVMIANNENDACSLMRDFQDAADDFIMAIRPIPALFEPPAIDNVAHQIQRFALDRMEKIKQQVGVTAFGAEMDVRDPDGAIFALGPETSRFGVVDPSQAVQSPLLCR